LANYAGEEIAGQTRLISEIFDTEGCRGFLDNGLQDELPLFDQFLTQSGESSGRIAT
jgi:hypothetical protein